MLRITENKQEIIREVSEGKFNINLSNHIVHLKSFIDKQSCEKIVRELKELKNIEKSSQYTDGLTNDKADSFFNPEIDLLEDIKKNIYDDAIKQYAERVRSFNWAYYNNKRFRYSEMIVRRYHPESKFDYHHDDIIIEIFPQWFPRRQNILTANIYFNDSTEYEGGDLYFPSVEKSIKPSVGDVILFPSNWMFYHKVNEIESGQRYAGTLWFYYGSEKMMTKQKDHDKYFAK